MKISRAIKKPVKSKIKNKKLKMRRRQKRTS